MYIYIYTCTLYMFVYIIQIYTLPRSYTCKHHMYLRMYLCMCVCSWWNGVHSEWWLLPQALPAGSAPERGGECAAVRSRHCEEENHQNPQRPPGQARLWLQIQGHCEWSFSRGRVFSVDSSNMHVHVYNIYTYLHICTCIYTDTESGIVRVYTYRVNKISP